MTNKYMRKIFNMRGHTGQTYQYYTEVYLISVTMSIIQKTKKNKCFRGCREIAHIQCYWECSASVMRTLLLGISTSATLIGNVNKNQSYTAIWNIKECHHYGNHGSSSKNKKEQ
jgi:hypothetical protein